MIAVTRYWVPPTGTTPLTPDMTSTYRDTIIKGLHTAGQIHPNKFWRLPTLGDVQVFRGSREPTGRIRASVILLWDFSSSQQGYKDELIHSMQMIVSALQRLRVDTWCGAYTTGIEGVIFEVKGWREKWDHRRANTLNQVRMGGTPTGVALLYVRCFIVPHAPQPRRMVLVCTDGEPGDSELVSAEINTLRGMGVRVCGLYVGGRSKIEPYLSHEYGRRYAFDAPERKSIPIVFNRILERLP